MKRKVKKNKLRKMIKKTQTFSRELFQFICIYIYVFVIMYLYFVFTCICIIVFICVDIFQKVQNYSMYFIVS